MKPLRLLFLACFACQFAAAEPAEADSNPAKVPVKTPAAAEPADLKPALISTELGGRDLLFLQTVAELGRMQSWLGEQAKNRAETDQVRAVGDALQATQVEEEKYLVQMAAKKGVHLDLAGAASPKALAEWLGKLKGPRFEKAVMERMVAIGQEAVGNYEAGVQSRDEDIKRYAEQMLPVAKDKLLLASRMAGSAPRNSGTPAFRDGPAEPAP